MRVIGAITKQRNPVPSKPSRIVHFHEIIREKRRLTKFVNEVEAMQQQIVQFNDTAGSPFDRGDNDLMRKSVAQTDVNRSGCDISSYVDGVSDDPKIDSSDVAGSFEVPNTVAQPEMTCGDVTESSENASAEIIPPVCVANRRNSHRLESVQQTHLRSQKQKRVMITRLKDKVALVVEQIRRLRKGARHSEHTDRGDKSDGSLRQKKRMKVRSNILRDFAAEMSPVVREKSKTHACHECGKGFFTKSNLSQHRRIHAGVKPFKCEDCGDAFSVRGNLTSHQRVHSDEKPFECLICSVTFRRKCNLSQHLLIHANLRPFACDMCDKSFRQIHHLSYHMNIHRGSRPFTCNVCEKTFRQQSQLTVHRKIHDKTNPKICSKRLIC